MRPATVQAADFSNPLNSPVVAVTSFKEVLPPTVRPPPIPVSLSTVSVVAERFFIVMSFPNVSIPFIFTFLSNAILRSEERRVGKEC